MKLLVLDDWASRGVIAGRKARGIDQHDEVWDGVYVVHPPPTNDQQGLVAVVCSALLETLGRATAAVHAGANVSDRADDWERNHRVPDVVVVLAGGQAVDRDTHWQGGPDFLVEVRSPGDDTLLKLPFYAGVGVREVLVVERDTRRPTLYRLGRGRLSPVRPTDVAGEPHLASAVVPLAFRLVETEQGPRLEARRTAGRKKVWRV